MTLVSLILFWLVPIGVGMLVDRSLGLIRLLTGRKSGWQDKIVDAKWWLVWFGLGSMVMFGLSMVVSTLGLFSSALLWVWLVLGICGFVGGVVWVRLAGDCYKRGLLIIPLSLILIAISGYVWFYQTPYSLNWDWYQHQLLARLIAQGELSFRTSALSDTFGFDSYPPVFHLLLAISQLPLWGDIDAIARYWTLSSLLQIVVVAIVAALLAHAIYRNKLFVFLAIMFSVLTFDSQVSFSTYFFLPQNVAATLAVVGLGWVIGAPKDLQTKDVLGPVVIAAAAMLFHFVVGSLGALFIAGLLCIRLLSNSRIGLTLGRKIPLIELALVVGIAIGLGSRYVDLGFLNQGEAADYTLLMEQKQQFFEDMYGYWWYLLLPLAVYSLIRSGKESGKLFLLAGFGFVVVLLSDYPYVLKFLTIARYLMVVGMALGMWHMLRYAAKPIRYALVLVVGFGLSLGLVVNVASWKSANLMAGQYVHAAEQDFEMARFLTTINDPGQLVLSDPATQFILEGLSGANTPGGAYMTLRNRKLLREATQAPSPEEVVGYLRLIEDGMTAHQTKLLVYTGRTQVWSEASNENQDSFSYNVWSPVLLSWKGRVFVDDLVSSGRATILYGSEYGVVMQIQ